jgi:ABC-type oligopeptide transport system ATPase subunit
LSYDRNYSKKAVTKPSLKMAVRQLSAYLGDNNIVMQKGKIVEMAEADQLYLNPQSEYTKKLIAALPAHAV